jgi:hypothetical protein
MNTQRIDPVLEKSVCNEVAGRTYRGGQHVWFLKLSKTAPSMISAAEDDGRNSRSWFTDSGAFGWISLRQAGQPGIAAEPSQRDFIPQPGE